MKNMNRDAFLAWFKAQKIGTPDYEGLSALETQWVIDDLSAPNYKAPVGFMKQLGVGTEDCTLILKFMDMDGNEVTRQILDLAGMYSAHNAGHLNESKDRIRKVRGKYGKPEFLASARDKNTGSYIKFLHAAHTILPGYKFIPKVGGAEVVETSLKGARRYKHLVDGVPEGFIIPLKGCFHGRTAWCISLSDNESAREGFEPLVGNVIRGVPYNNIPALRAVLEQYRGKVAAIILEPIQGEGGVIVPDTNYLQQVAELAREFKVLLIVDEIQTGMGRTGGRNAKELFVFQRKNIEPDLICAGKAVGGGELPFSFVAGKPDIMNVLTPGTEGATWSGYPEGCEVFAETVKEMLRCEYAVASFEKGELMLDKLKNTLYKHSHAIKDIRGEGLFIGLELHETFCTGREFSYALAHKGMSAKETGVKGQTIRLAPPLTITYQQIGTCVDAIIGAIHLIEKKRSMIQMALKMQETR